MILDTPTIFHAAPDLHWRRLDDEVVVYLAQRLETHLLDNCGGQVLEAMQEMQRSGTPCSTVSLYTWLLADAEADEPGQTDTQSPDTMLMPLLNELMRIGAITAQVC